MTSFMMGEDPDYDYEMDPQAVPAAFGASVEDTMDDVTSESMAMSDSGTYAEAVDKTGIDVDFQDSTNPDYETADLPAPFQASGSISSGQFENVDISGTVVSPSENQVYEVEAAHGVDFKAEVPYEALPEAPAISTDSAQVAIEPAAEANNERQEAFEQPHDHVGTSHAVYEEDEVDELRHDPEQSKSPNGVNLGHAFQEADQLEAEDKANGGASHEESGEGEEAQSGYENGADGFFQADDQQAAAVRVTFNGQDFVMWSSADIPAYLALPDKVQGSNQLHQDEELLEIEAPAIEVQQDVLWQPLDSLFASLREKKALGEFLEDSQELHLTFSDLDLHVAEDNLYCREITLDDLLQLHHGLGLATSLRIQVSERPRFITKYNELAQHVAGIFGNQLQHSSDDSEVEEVAYHQHRDGCTRKGEDSVNLEAKESSSASDTHQQTAAEKALGIHVTTAGVLGDDSGSGHATVQGEATKSTPSTRDVEQSIASPTHRLAVVPAERDITQHDEVAAEEAKEDAHEADELQSAEKPSHQGDSEQTAKDLDRLEVPVDVARERNRADEVGDYEGEAGQGRTARNGEGGAEGQEEQAVDFEAEPEEAVAAAYDAVGHGSAEEVGDQVEWEGEDAEGKGEYEDQEYADDAEYAGEEGEQTFYTTVNEDSDAEEDELEEPGQHLVEGTYHTEGHEYELTHPDETNDDHEGQQGKLYFPTTARIANISANESTLISLAFYHTEGSEDQIVEYIEEQGEGITNAQRKRGLIEDDDDAQYEEDGDYEAESKRVKVD
ncbi:uncharacterized protein MEPE_03158 [Melanopsichium pennsylvanicum]|uniref:Uncharacterized protein n=2 Tax=Melanopsichium pennsylvanicum TaxID=63383 RepID=A0AAJ5C5E5_9BASI|nr:uncharacterized protein BN887_01289 [Melanopsichium pennsylvanicum 4]SNX84449.1 uncharacterized protein MEPE_03158 [Melanopsichium pennsylvanicum]